jgi:hypothetical protein
MKLKRIGVCFFASQWIPSRVFLGNAYVLLKFWSCLVLEPIVCALGGPLSGTWPLELSFPLVGFGTTGCLFFPGAGQIK